MLRSRLEDPDHANSDINVQSILLILSYVADFGKPDEIAIHAEALKMMVSRRGGVSAFRGNPVLFLQLCLINTSRLFHLTMPCGLACTDAFRFPMGFW